jgi:arsenate reductase-like glutaredoxin family protein
LQRSNSRSETKSKITAPTIFKENDISIEHSIADEIITRGDLKEIVDQLNERAGDVISRSFLDVDRKTPLKKPRVYNSSNKVKKQG